MEESAKTFDVFISYRRGDASRLAKWLQNKLQTYKPSREVSARLPDDVKVRLSRGLGVFLDKSNARTSEDFWSTQILPALERSRYLLVISTASALQQRPDGDPNWVEREIDAFWASDGERSHIVLALGPGAPADRLPGRLHELSSLWGWADLRAWSPLYRIRRGAEAVEGAFVDILATIADIPTELVPRLRDEER